MAISFAAYAFLGYQHDAPIEATPLTLATTKLHDGDTLGFSADLTAATSTPVHVMYVVSSTTSAGRPREKTYFLLRGTAEPDRKLHLAKSHTLRSTATVKLTPGPCTIALQVNGRRLPAADFRILEA
ncbi:hypothetical protein [Streptomyces albus]|uniref:hypothetical protein n=1 Tax=Streptomyces sp. NRRL F-5917 TaxID=1463873 RepID=UPI0004C26679|nr:hypothetical protein [Streptomyces sp. NRRL F-5917]